MKVIDGETSLFCLNGRPQEAASDRITPMIVAGESLLAGYLGGVSVTRWNEYKLSNSILYFSALRLRPRSTNPRCRLRMYARNDK